MKSVNFKNIVLKYGKDLLFLIVGNLLLAISYSAFVEPLNIVTGGSGGVGIVIANIFHVDSKMVVTVFIWAMFLLGAIILGKDFALKTLAGAILYPILIMLVAEWDFLIARTSEINNQLLGGIVGAALCGAGVGLIFMVGGSSGGTDIPAFIIQKYFRVKAEKVIFITDCLIILFGAFFVSFESALVGIMYAFVTMIVIDRILLGGSETMLLYIISDKYEIINNHIQTVINRGTTLIPSIGGYTMKEKMTIQVVINRSNYHELEKYIKEVDHNAFVTVLNAKDVYGLGFKRFSQ